MLESLAPSFLYSVCKDAIGFVTRAFRKSKRRLSPTEKIEKRQQLKVEIEQRLWQRRQKKLGMDVVIRDVKRVDEYPDIKCGKGISAWYKSGLMGTYHRGILLGLSWEMLTSEGENKWRYTNHNAGETGELKVILIGYVPYENIEAINWNGDEFYGEPHLYCHFDAKRGEPYEKLAFCEEKELNGIPSYTEVCFYEPVRRLSKQLSIR